MTTKTDPLVDAVKAAIDAGAIADYAVTTGGNERTWKLVLPDGVSLDTGGELKGLKTRDVKMLLAGIEAGRASAPQRATRTLNPRTKAIRDALVRDRYVEVKLEDAEDKAEQKRVRNAIFTQAYSLGYKGKFKVKTVGDLVIGEVTK